MANLGLNLKGEFKFELYNSNKQLIHSSDFVDNFITNSGVLYPYYFAFADCFRYLSVGTGTGINSVIRTGGSYPDTTGLQHPLTGSGYAYVGGRPAIVSSETYYGTGCGFTETASGVNLFRQWTLPLTGYFTGNQTLNEFMVSPGQPFVTGYAGQNLCTCDESDSTQSPTVYGNDCSVVAMYYNWVQQTYNTYGQFRPTICDATTAFARVLYPINVVANSTLNVSYRLSVNISTGINYLQLNNSVVGIDPNWSGKLGTVSRLTQAGIKLINDSNISQETPPTAPNGSNRLQHFNYPGSAGGNFDYEFTNEYGESFIPPMGIPLEPSILNIPFSQYQNIVYYLSNDNTEFLVSSSGIFSNTGNYAPWVSTSGIIQISNSGLAPFVNNNSSIINQGSQYWVNNINTFNIRKSTNVFPNTGDITQSGPNIPIISYQAPPGNLSIPTSGIFLMNNGGIRTGQLSYNFNFFGYQDSNNPLFVKSLVAGYIDAAYPVSLFGGDSTNSVPFFDSIFFGTGIGSIFLPALVTGGNDITYGNGTNTGVFISGAGYNNYSFLLNLNGIKYPIFDTILTWTVPCPQGVTGC